MKRLAIALLVLGLALPLVPRVAEHFAADSCLDRGGSYDYRRSTCDFDISHPFVPWSKRPHSPLTSVAGALAFLSGVGLLIRVRSHRTRELPP